MEPVQPWCGPFPTPVPPPTKPDFDAAKRPNTSMVPSTPQEVAPKKRALAVDGPAPVRNLFPSTQKSSLPFPKPNKERRQELWQTGSKGKGASPTGTKGKGVSPPLPPSARRCISELKENKGMLQVLFDLYLIFTFTHICLSLSPSFDNRWHNKPWMHIDSRDGWHPYTLIHV